MEDKMIVDLYWERSEDAISETEKKYGKYCHAVAFNVLGSNLDAEECVSDTYLRAWDAMPPHRPSRLSTFLGKITRNLALNRYYHNTALKRSAPIELVLDEVAEFIPADTAGGTIADEIALKDAINRFLASLPKRERMIFVRRYWYISPIGEIADDFALSESNVKVILLRTRNKFKAHLENEGIQI